MTFLLQDKPVKFLLAMQNQKENKDTILNIGRKFYSCNNSIYDALDRFEGWGILEVLKGKRDLKVKFTKKGQEVLDAISILAIY